MTFAQAAEWIREQQFPLVLKTSPDVEGFPGGVVSSVEVTAGSSFTLWLTSNEPKNFTAGFHRFSLDGGKLVLEEAWGPRRTVLSQPSDLAELLRETVGFVDLPGTVTTLEELRAWLGEHLPTGVR